MKMREEVPMPPSVPKYVSLALLFMGALFYISWVLTDPSTWNDIGVYSVTVVFIAFGAGGYFLYSHMEKQQETDDER